MRLSHSIGAVFGFLCAGFALTATTQADQLQYFKIGSGSKGGVYYPISYGIASSISNPPMS